MANGQGTRVLVAVVLASLAGCGGGTGGEAGTSVPAPSGENPNLGAATPEKERDTSGEEGGSGGGDDVLVGSFIDSPVAGLAWQTETRSGVTDEAGRFEYLPGETVVFSLGDLSFSATPAAERITPVDLARDADDPERFAVNLARLLQTLDADGEPENGIELPAAAADLATAIDFDVEPVQFAADASVINLVAGAGGVRQALISEARAREHFGLALAASPSRGATAAIAGFWQAEASSYHEGLVIDEYDFLTDEEDVDVSFGNRTIYHAISESGEWRVFTTSAGNGSDCLAVEHRTFTALGKGRYLGSSLKHGGMDSLEARVEDGALRITRSNSFGPVSSRFVPALGVAPETLDLCDGESLQRPPRGAGLTAPIAGLWETEEEDGETSYFLVSSAGRAEYLRPLAVFGPAPEYAMSTCLLSVESALSVTGRDVFTADALMGGDLYYHWTLRLEGEALTAEAYRESTPRTLEKSTAALDTLRRCGTDTERNPVDEIVGLWRNEGNSLYEGYLHIDDDGQVTEYTPSLGGLHCYVASESRLVATGGRDFAWALADGTEHAVRIEPAPERLVISDVQPDGGATPVRWLVSATGLEPNLLARCEIEITAEDLAAFAPLVGTWARTDNEFKGPYGANGSTIVYSRRDTIWTIGSNGLSERVGITTELKDRFDGKAEYRTCRRDSHTSAVQLEPLGRDVFRLEYQALTIARSGETLRAASPYDDASWESSDVDASALETCSSEQDPYSSQLWPRGVWEISPFEPGKAGALFLFNGYDNVVYQGADGTGNCGETLEMQIEQLADGKVLLGTAGRGDGELSAIGRLSLVEDELRVELDSAEEGFPLRDGSYPRALGIDPERVRYRPDCY